MSTEQNPYRDSEPVQPTVEIPTSSVEGSTASPDAVPGTAPYSAPDPAPYPAAASVSSSSTSSASTTSAPTAPSTSSPSTGSPSAASPATGTTTGVDDRADRAQPLVRTGPRSITVVWGFVVVAVALGLLARASGASVDAELGAIVLLSVAGVLLVVTSVIGAARRRSRQRAAA
jgi:cobalamin biosynthesis Mg chelatase CobN